MKRNRPVTKLRQSKRLKGESPDCPPPLAADQSAVTIHMKTPVARVLFPRSYRRQICSARTKKERCFRLVLQMDSLDVEKDEQVIFFITNQKIVHDAIIVARPKGAPATLVCYGLPGDRYPESYTAYFTRHPDVPIIF